MTPLPRNTTDETDHEYGCLQVLAFAGIEGEHATWLCECRCGEPSCKGRITTRGVRLRKGHVVSCGALRGNSGIRRQARMKVPAKRRLQIAKMGGAAFARSKAAPST
jgi:hypothetical protein